MMKLAGQSIIGQFTSLDADGAAAAAAAAVVAATAAACFP